MTIYNVEYKIAHDLGFTCGGARRAAGRAHFTNAQASSAKKGKFPAA